MTPTDRDLIGCGAWIGGVRTPAGRCGEVGLCGTCWERDGLVAENTQLREERDAAEDLRKREELAHTIQHNGTVIERNEARAEVARLTTERDEARDESDLWAAVTGRPESERDSLRVRAEKVEAERDAALLTAEHRLLVNQAMEAQLVEVRAELAEAREWADDGWNRGTAEQIIEKLRAELEAAKTAQRIAEATARVTFGANEVAIKRCEASEARLERVTAALEELLNMTVRIVDTAQAVLAEARTDTL